MRIVILGYTGFIGKAILESLAKNNFIKLICVAETLKKNLLKIQR